MKETTKQPMITFDKQNDIVSHILNNGVKVGHVEKHSGGYWIEVYYDRAWMPNRDYNKRNINNYIKAAVNYLEGSIHLRIQSEQNLIRRGFTIKG